MTDSELAAELFRVLLNKRIPAESVDSSLVTVKPNRDCLINIWYKKNSGTPIECYVYQVQNDAVVSFANKKWTTLVDYDVVADFVLRQIEKL